MEALEDLRRFIEESDNVQVLLPKSKIDWMMSL